MSRSEAFAMLRVIREPTWLQPASVSESITSTRPLPAPSFRANRRPNTTEEKPKALPMAKTRARRAGEARSASWRFTKSSTSASMMPQPVWRNCPGCRQPQTSGSGPSIPDRRRRSAPEASQPTRRAASGSTRMPRAVRRKVAASSNIDMTSNPWARYSPLASPMTAPLRGQGPGPRRSDIGSRGTCLPRRPRRSCAAFQRSRCAASKRPRPPTCALNTARS
mmetsp:Transcript_37867/g.113096  ORF Transcript_37867/g.113096 Transcript_37867/m.113096 type:complete len:222 (+) Transcript_37867:423-1088(+)